MHVFPLTHAARLAGLVVIAAVALAAAPSPVAGAAEAPYSLQLRALTGPRGADLRLEVDAAAGNPQVSALKKVQLKVYAMDGSLEDVRNLTDRNAPDGVETLDLGAVERGRLVEAEVLVQPRGTERTYVLRGSARTRLRPDLVVAAVDAPPQTLTTRPVDVRARIAELNGDTAATATVTLMWGPSPVGEPQEIAVPAGEEAWLTFAGIELTAAAPAELTVVVSDVEPGQTSTTNDSRTTTVEVTEHELVRPNVVVPSLGGYGAQFNQHVYAPITGAPTSSLPDMEAKAKALEPQLVRIFYNDNWEERRADAPANMESFVKTVRLAQEAGATINVTYQAVNVAKLQPVESMTQFAAVLENLVEVEGITNLRWVTVANEPNSTVLTLPEYEALYRALDAQLVARGLRDQIRLMGGDLVESGSAVGSDHRNWFRYMAEHMTDLLDAYSVHIYWNYHNIPRMEFRLRDVHKIVTEELPIEARKPTYIMEFAVRGKDPFPAKPTPRHAYYEDGSDMRRTNVAGFQTLWFFLASAQLGYTGTAKWDAYWGMYDLSSPGNQSYWMTGSAAEGWPLFPTYHALHLLLQTTQRGWQVVQLAPWAEDDWKVGVPDRPEQEIAAFASSDGFLTLMGLDTRGRELNVASTEPPAAYSIGGLPPSTNFSLVLWNEAADGLSSRAGTIATSAAGVARFEVPLHAAFALTTVPVA
jgi:hypothetical protein